jgi:hypothetical protein
MTGPHMETKLNEYVDGTLAARDRASVDAHLAECASCRAGVAELQSLSASAASLPKSIEPRRDLWPGIGRRIGRRATWNAQWFWRGALAAAAMLVLAVGIYRLFRVPRSDFRVGEGQGWAAVQAEFDRTTGELGLIFAVERARLRPETVALLERNLAIIDAAIRESRAALARDPASAELRQLYAAAAREKVELLRWAARVAAS